MKRAYSIVWSIARQMWTVVSELASDGGKPVPTTLRAVTLSAVLTLLPTGQAVAAFTAKVENITVRDERIDSSGTQIVTLGGKTINTSVENGGKQIIIKAGIAAETILNGGIQEIAPGGTANITTILTGGYQIVNYRGLATDTTIESGGRQKVLKGAEVRNTTIKNGGQQLILQGVARDTTIEDGGKQSVKGNHGKARTTIINNGGQQIVSDGASAYDTTVNSGGVQDIVRGARARDTIINSGGSQIVDGSSALSTTINGGEQIVLDGGSTVGTVVNDGGLQGLSHGGVATDTVVNRGGYLTMQDGVLRGRTVIAGGGNLSGKIISEGTVDTAAGSHWALRADSSVASLIHAGNATFGWHLPKQDSLTPLTLTLGSLSGENGVFTLRTDVNNGISDRLVIDGGSATGHSLLSVTSQGIGRATQGEGIIIVGLLNGGQTTTDAFRLAHKIEAGAYNYNLRRSTAGSWHLTTDVVPDAPVTLKMLITPETLIMPDVPVDPGSLPAPDYRVGLSAYLSTPAVATQLDRYLAGQAAQGRRVNTEQKLWWNAGGARLDQNNVGNLLAADHSELGGAQMGLVMGSDLLRYETDAYALWGGIYAGTGYSDMNAWRNGLRDGSVKDTAWTGGVYLGATHESGARAELALQGSHHQLRSQTSTGQGFSTDGRSWSVATEAGYAFGLAEALSLEPYAGWSYRQTDVEDSRDRVSALRWGSDSRHEVTTGLRLGSPGGRNETGRLARAVDLPVSWWTGASVTQTFARDTVMKVSAPGVSGSTVNFSGDNGGASGRLEAGMMAEVRPDVQLGVGTHWSSRLSGHGEEGYGGEVKLKVGF